MLDFIPSSVRTLYASSGYIFISARYYAHRMQMCLTDYGRDKGYSNKSSFSGVPTTYVDWRFLFCPRQKVKIRLLNQTRF